MATNESHVTCRFCAKMGDEVEFRSDLLRVIGKRVEGRVPSEQ